MCVVVCQVCDGEAQGKAQCEGKVSVGKACFLFLLAEKSFSDTILWGTPTEIFLAGLLAIYTLYTSTYTICYFTAQKYSYDHLELKEMYYIIL